MAARISEPQLKPILLHSTRCEMAPIKRKSGEKPVAERPAKKQRPPTTSTATLATLKEEPAFPRGGANILTPLEQKQINIQAKQDVLFEQNTGKRAIRHEFEEEENDEELPTTQGKSPVKGKSKARSIIKKSKSSVAVQERSVKVEGLSYKRLVPGSMVLGQVSQINTQDIALTLPNNLTGYVPLTSISERVTKSLETLADIELDDDEGAEEKAGFLDVKAMFRIGQYLRACVVSADEDNTTGVKGKRHISLSIDPHQSNAGLAASDLVVNSMVQASVHSIEDHGLIMDLGVKDENIKGFMSSKDLGTGWELSNIQEGAVLLCQITGKSSNGKIVKLTADQTKIGNIKKGSYLTDGPSINTFLPGTAVDVLVSEVTDSGLVGKVMGMINVTADLIHSGAASSGKDLEKKHPVGSKLKARILCTFPTSEETKLGISLQDHVVYWRDKTTTAPSPTNNTIPTKSLSISSVIEKATVVKVEPHVGLFVDVGVKGVRGFVHISRISEGKVESISGSEGPYKLGSAHKGRVLGYNSMDGLFIVSLEPKIIDEPFLRLEDVKVGQLVKGTITKLLVGAEGVSGLIVQIADRISGLVPETHLADVKLQHPEWKFKEGGSVAARVLSTSLEKRQMRLTLKKSLVNSDVEPWTSYESLKVGMKAPGTLVNILPSGSVVQFYGPVRAFLPVSEMSESFIQDPREHFRAGQVVAVHIVSVDSQEKRMIVSCKDPSNFGTVQRQALSDLKSGEIVAGTVTAKTNDEIIIELQSSGLKAILSNGHLTDGSLAKATSAAKKIRVGQALKELVVLSKDEAKHLVRLSRKPSFVKAASSSKLLTTFEDVEADAEVVGYVDNVTEKGVFVRFGEKLTGLMLKQHLQDGAALLPDFGMSRHQTVTARVLSVDHDNQKFLLTMRPVDTKEPEKAKPSQSHEFQGLSTGGFDWTGGMKTFEEPSPQSDPDVEAKSTKKKKRRKAEIKVDRTGDLDAHGPQSVADFERLLLGQPNSSVLWLSYMAFHLQNGDAATARAIAERALKTIHISEQGEKLNVWVALLNLENTYGTDETLEEVFKRACQYNDSENIHVRLISIFIQSGQPRKADDLFQAALKKHTQTPALWLNYATFLMTTQNAPDRARALLPRAMQALPPHSHLNLTHQFAQLEFNSPNGDAERGRTVFETLLSQWPKRLDLWNVLLDLEMKNGGQERVRRLFERVTGEGMKLKPRKAKYFFKRWLGFEEKAGDRKSAERVKALAAEYVEKAGKGG